jgi:hypothetical protein
VRNRPWFTSRCVFVFCLCAAVAGFSLKPAEAQTKPNIMSWGENMAGWNEKLGLTAVREGCSIYPTECEPWLDNVAVDANVKNYYVSMPFSVSDSVAWAKEYSVLSLTHKMMTEISFDDYVNQIEDHQIDGSLPNPATFTSEVIAATKSANPNLAFGVTIYEDSLTHVALTSLPATLRAQIQYVHLYVHYRLNGPNYASYVTTAKSIFPNAKIIAGAYPYDRIDYLPCAYKGTVYCTAAQEQSLYKQTLEIQLSLVKAGTIYGLEFFFGYFGDPQDWPSWTLYTRICQPARLSTCYENSNTLQSITLQVLQGTLTPTVSLQHTSFYMGSEKVGVEGTPGAMAVTNSGGGPLSITGIGVSGINSTEFPLTHNCPATLAAGASCTLTIYFRPAGTGTRDAEIVIFDNAGSGEQTVTLTGTGLSSGGAPAVSLQHTSVYMGHEVVGVQGTPAKMLMTNSGAGTLSISSFSISGTNSTNFSLTQNCGTSLAAGASCTLTIYFRPSAVGTRTGSIIIKDNAGTGTQTVTLSGLGQ